MTREEFIYGLNACGFLVHGGKCWYEHDELIECFEGLSLIPKEDEIGKENKKNEKI